MSELLARVQKALGEGYRVERELGGGGMSHVFVADELALGRRVVVKVLPPDAAADVNAERFQREIRLAASLQHPHIVPVHTARRAGELFFYTMPLVEGESLGARIARAGPLPIPDVVRILRDVADALAYAHARGVVHRDVKPDNILLSGGHAMVTDFGVAKALTEAAGHTALTSVGLVLGTPAYMAPEQAAGDPDVDGRADLYALGVVAYEMLAGRPPFAGGTPRQVIAAHIARPPEPIATHRPDVPVALAAAVERCLAKDPAERWGTADDLVRYLDTGVTATPAAPAVEMPRHWRRWLVAAGIVAVLAAAALASLRTRGSRALEPDLVAIAPFDVFTPSLALWREGLVDILARGLDGAGPLRTVPPSIVVRRWGDRRADPATAAALASESRAGLAVFGQVLGEPNDSVRVTATVIDAQTGQVLAEVELRAHDEGMARLTDSLTVSLLRHLGRSRSIGAMRTTALGSTSLPALKAFLQGEQYFRRALWDSATVAYERAVHLDGTLALAYARLSRAVGWRRVGTDSLSRAYALQAGALNRNLAPRDSLLVQAESLAAPLWGYDSEPQWWRLSVRLFAMLDAGVRRYPEDPELWYQLAEARYHFGYWHGINWEDALNAFDRVIAADSTFAPAYVHPVELALSLGDADRARRYATAYLALDPRDAEGEGIPLAASLLGYAGVGGPALAGVPKVTLVDAWIVLKRWPDSAETAIRLARALAVPDTGDAARPLIQTLSYRGHVREAAALAYRRVPGLFAEHALLGVVSADSATAWVEQADPETQSWMALPWWGARGDTGALQAATRWPDSIARAGSPAPYGGLAQYATARIAAYLALARGDTGAALTRFQSLPESLCAGCVTTIAWDRLVTAQVLFAHGQPAEAAPYLATDAPISAGYQSAREVIAVLTRARVAEALGRRAEAIRDFGYVVEVWRKADPDVRRYVDEARAALGRLGGEGRR